MFFSGFSPITVIRGLRRRSLLLLAAALLALAGGCIRMPGTGITPMEFARFSDMEHKLLSQKPDLAQFRLRGPFAVITHSNHEIRPSAAEPIIGDLYLSTHAGRAPLVILLHGDQNSKDDHAYQALHLATWGMHSLSLQLPNKGPWSNHGRTLARLVDFIQKHPEDIDARIDPRKIILVGHSFGGSSVAYALGLGAPVAGGVLLDPAAIGRDLRTFLRKIDKPVLVLGADENIIQANGRENFYRYIRGNVAEISVWDADHDDAQFSLDVDTPNEQQLGFVSALTAAAFSLAATGRLDYAWSSFSDALRAGWLIEPKKK